MSKFKAIIICGFPGVGKTTAEQRCRQAIDCESSGFQYRFDPTEVNAGSPAGVYKENQNWVEKYVDQLVELAMDVRYHYVFASTHQEVRDELCARFIPYVVVVPDRSLKDEYLSRYVMRGDSAEFIMGIYENWDDWLKAIDIEAPAVIHLKAGQVLSDILPIPQLRG